MPPPTADVFCDINEKNLVARAGGAHCSRFRLRDRPWDRLADRGYAGAVTVVAENRRADFSASDHVDARRRYRVLFLSPVGHLKGGAERNLVDLFDMADVDPVLAVPEPGPLSVEAERRGIPVVTFRMGAIAEVHRPLNLLTMLSASWDAIRCARRVSQLCRSYRCEFVHSNGMKTHVIACLARVFFGVRVVQHFNDIPYSKLERRVWRLLGFVADRVIVLSRPCWPAAALPRNVRIIPSALTVPPGPPEWREPKRPIRLGFVGRFHPQKGLDLLIDWVVAARDAGIDWRLVLRGRASPEDTEYWHRIEARFHEAGIANRITVEGWRDWQGDWRAVYSDVDVLLVPSIQPEPLGRVIMEAMGSGVPAIAYPAGGIPTLVKHGSTGYLAASPASFVTALQQLVSDPANFNVIRRRGFNFMQEEFSMSLHHRRIAEIFHSVVD